LNHTERGNYEPSSCLQDCRGFLELSGFVAHELSAFFTLVGKLRRA
jgi:hypothetical protein